MLNRIETTYRELLASNPSIDVLFSGNPNEQGILFPTPILERAYQVYFQNPDYHPHPKGLLEAREAIAHYYSEQNLKVSPESICLTSGSSESFFHLFSILTEIGDHVLAPLPSYPLFDHIAQMARIELKH
ncbi:MAG: aminotransferase class I/II-fold pyridoxal phosphate-dependent enzyme, partial [Deltaproteobacteria bacterium]|nr:aminotransferase class I/II-fold pyridoxal phosphate-dependent enzyme [Deltaproteobacteria bacterium]